MSSQSNLRNDHTVFILGAGYSVTRGLPLVSGFMNKIRDAAVWCEREGRNWEADALTAVLKFRLDAASAAYRVPIDLENIEELFSLASAADKRIGSSVKISIAATLNYCMSRNSDPVLRYSSLNAGTNDLGVASRRSDNSDPNQREMALYDAIAIKILGIANPKRTSIITFNYDDLIERSAERVGVDFNFGFSKVPEISGDVRYSNDGLSILKLHGSVNWAYAGKRNSKFTVFRNYESVLAERLTPEIVPPTWNKAIADRLSGVWMSAIDRISTATKLVIIGFSMPQTDLYFKYLLAAGMKNNLSLRKVVFVDPSDLIAPRLKNVFADREVLSKRVIQVKSELHKLGGFSDVHPHGYFYKQFVPPY